MKSIRAQFVRPRRLPRVLWVLPAAALAAAIALWGLVWRQQRELEIASQAIELARSQAAELALRRSRPAPPAPTPYEASAREFLRERLLPWPEVLNAIEAVAIPGATPNAIELTSSDARVRIELSIGDHDRLLDYVDSLNAGVPVEGLAWRWSVTAIQKQQGVAGTAQLLGRRAVR